jgi:hypothetical protein
MSQSVRTGLTSDEIKQDFRENMRCGLGRLKRFATTYDQYYALALTVRDLVLQRTVESMESYGGANARRVPVGRISARPQLRDPEPGRDLRRRFAVRPFRAARRPRHNGW